MTRMTWGERTMLLTEASEPHMLVWRLLFADQQVPCTCGDLQPGGGPSVRADSEVPGRGDRDVRFAGTGPANHIDRHRLQVGKQTKRPSLGVVHG